MATATACGRNYVFLDKSRNLFKFLPVLLSASVDRVGVSRMRDFYKVRQPSELEVKFMLKCYHLGGKGGANHPPKGPQTRSARGGVQ